MHIHKWSPTDAVYLAMCRQSASHDATQTDHLLVVFANRLTESRLC